MEYARHWQNDRGQTTLREDAHLLPRGSLVQARPDGAHRLSEGAFWFVIATTVFLALLEARARPGATLPLSAGWAGVFVLYYALRSSWILSCWETRQQAERGRQPGWHSRVLFQLLLDLLVITILVALSGGWISPLYLLYLGWAVVLIDEVSTTTSVCLAGLACTAWVAGSFLASHQQRFSTPQIIIIAEHALLLLMVALGMGGIRAYVSRIKLSWEAERRQWDEMRQAVFSHLAHELYTPLSAISASASLLAATNNEQTTERRQNLFGAIERNCARMNLLIDDLLALWREQRYQPDCIPVRLRCLAVVESVAQMLSPLLGGKQQRLVVLADPPGVSVLADARRLEQILVNLLANAQKYAPVGTPITLTLKGQQREVLFAVHDEGAGIPLEEQSHLFEIFYRGTNCPPASRGAGIGLALAKALVVLQGGCIWVESAPGEGSTFYFTLPAADRG
jgi:signal transduction histidine kinase